VDLDVRDDIRAGREPFNRIVATVRTLEPGDVLVLRAPFEPAPLYAVLGARGLTHWTECLASDDWRVWFYPTEGPIASDDASAGAAGADTLDVRGLPPPQPMLRVLERLDTLAPGAALTVLHDRRPMFLYPQLEDRGFTHETEEPAPGLVRIVIRRPAAP
jgi:uncharacterized protein (DUF2249 family)